MGLDYDKSIEYQNLPVSFPRSGSDFEKLKWRLAFDVRYVCATLLKITAKNKNELMPLKFNRGQMWIYWLMLDQWRNGEAVRLWVLKGRQFGVSTMVSAVLFIAASLWNRNCLQLPHKERPGVTMFGKIDRFLTHFPRSVRDGPTTRTLIPKPTTAHAGDVIAWNTKEKQGLVKRETAENEDAGVSETYQFAHLTEVPLWKNAHHTMGGLLPTIPATDPGSLIIGEFTARAEGDYAHTIWVQCMAGQSPFQGVFLPWYWHEDYTRPRVEDDAPLTREEREYMALVKEAGYTYPLESGTMKLKPQFAAIRKKRKFVPQDMATGFVLTDEHMMWRRDRIDEFAGDMDMWCREYPATPAEAFSKGGRRVIPPQTMDQLDVAAKKWPIIDKGEYEARRGIGGRTKRIYRKSRGGERGRVWRYELPVAGAYYVLDADTSSGVGEDYSAAHILRVEPNEIVQVVSFQGKVRPPDFAAILSRMGMHYKSHMEWSDEVAGKVDPKSGVPSLIVVERNNHGEHVIHELTENLGYRRLYRHEERGRVDNWKLGHRYGFPVTKATKIPMLVNLQTVAYDGKLIVPCERTRTEMRNLIYLDDMDEKAGAPRGAHDDLAMALGEGVFVATGRAGFRAGKQKPGTSGRRRMLFPAVGR